MGMMTHMRDRMHVVLWALLILFLLSMTIGGLVGGANVIDELLGKVDPRKAIGVVNGTNISPDDFMQMVSAEMDQYRYSGQEITDQRINQIREGIWDRMVTQILISDYLEDIGIEATDEEVLFHIQEAPPAFLTSLPDFQTNGQFDQAKYLQAVMNPQGNEWMPVENHMRYTFIPNFKLEQYINASITVNEEEIQKEYAKHNVEYTVSALHAMTNSFTGADIEPTDDEIAGYYKANSDEFHQIEHRNVRYVSWLKTPSPSDTLRAYEQALDLKDQALRGTDFATLADSYTEDPGNAVTADSGRGGSLGWFGKGQMVKPFEEAAFKARVGEVVGPVLSQFGYHVIKVIDKRNSDGKEQVNASHILLKIEMGSNTREELRRASTLFSYDALDYGFDAALDTHSVDAQEATNLNTNSIYVAGLGQFRGLVRFAFNTESGTISNPLENDSHYVVAVVDSIIPAGLQPLEVVKEAINGNLRQEKQKVAALALITDLKSQLAPELEFADLAAESDLVELVAEDTKPLARGFSSVGLSNQIVGALQVAEPGDIIGPAETMRGYALVQLIGSTTFDSTQFEIQHDVLKNDLIGKKQNQFYNDWIQTMKDEAEIVDNRKYYF